MSYNPTTDFIALSRAVGGVSEVARMPGLDYVLAALARTGLVRLSISQTAPNINQPVTVWLRPALPSWTAEGAVFLWNAVTTQYEPATPALWNVFIAYLSPYVSGYDFQSVPGAVGTILAGKSLAAIQRATPAATNLTLPALLSQQGKPLQIVDWSANVVNHIITLTPTGGASVMRRGAWTLLSTADQLAGITLYPSTDLNGWVIAP